LGYVAGGAGAATGGSGGATMTGSGCTPPATYPNLFVTVSGQTQADSDSKVAAAWTSMFTAGSSSSIYYNGPGSDESYVEDTYNNDVRTEGMSYGMMIAVQLGHQTEFDRLWTFVKNHMAQGTGQIAWHVSTSGSKLATGGAPDGDEYFAEALIFAHTRWGDTSGKYNYGTEAQWVLNLLRTMEFNTTYHIVEFYAGAGNTDGSYILPAFYQTWACFDTANADFWNSAVTAGRNWFHNAINSNGVIPDQSAFTNGSSGSAGSDTIRCVANIMMDHNFFDADSWQTDTYAPKYASYESSHANGVAQQSCDALLGFGLPASTGKPFVDKLWSTSVPKHDYWNGVLYMLAMLHVSGTFHLWY
jgi:oligosaccharide reducing-end xylanase